MYLGDSHEMYDRWVSSIFGYRVLCDFGIDVSIHRSGLCPVPISPSAEMMPGVLPGLTMPSRKGSLLPHSGHQGGK